MPEDLSELITPKTPGVSPEAPPTSPEAETPPNTEGSNLPDELIRLPVVQGLLAGDPPAVSQKIKGFGKTTEEKLITEHKQELLDSGIQFYKSLSGDIGVMYNAMQISGEDIKAADRAGKLLEIAPPADVVNAQIGKMGADEHPTLNFKGVPGGLAAPTAPLPPQSATAPMPMPSGSPGGGRDRLMAQIKNLQPGAPTSGPKPGQGALLRSILKPVL